MIVSRRWDLTQASAVASVSMQYLQLGFAAKDPSALLAVLVQAGPTCAGAVAQAVSWSGARWGVSAPAKGRVYYPPKWIFSRIC
jgi:hypothetical protein